MTEETTAPQPLSELDRLTGVLFDPQPAYTDIAARPARWWVPLLLLAVLSLGFTYAFTQRVGWERFMRQQLASNPRVANLPAEQREQIIAQQAQFAPIIGYVSSVLGGAVLALIWAGVFLFVFNLLMGSEVRFGAAYAVSCYALLPYFLRGLVTFVVLYLKDPADFDLENPLATNLGAFLDPSSVPRWVVSPASSLDLFNAWVVLLLATGFAAAARRVSWRQALAWVGATWVLWLLVKGVGTWIFS